MTSSNVITIEFAKELEQSEIQMVSSRLQSIKNIQNNHLDVEIATFGSATAFSVKGIPGPSFNTVKGLDHSNIDDIDEILRFYNEKKIPCRFEITPAHSTPELLKTLTSYGYYQSDFHTTLYGYVDEKLYTPPEKNISIRLLKEEEFDLFTEIYAKSFQLPPFIKPGVEQNNQVLHDHPDWRFYIATYDGEPAAIGASHVKNNICTLAASATLPHLRNKGLHTALIQKRIQHAILNSCSYLVGQTRFGSISQNNMERNGMTIAYTKGIWTSIK
ncbi:GNAT family N-acetyltransferase [Evansella sp. AB-P1]|uniref:GNAT family N-acetyltransferase n=1 Tax=Evansella sp. AB-P1 TaxID=3037653 RepID=UPI00241C4021|nr:GNAT family N-acetyltransferase [Evansella sp. AB-P1]MDG5786080.1 GNAT family N-acetyltransferase [Evansella sp. AB-P1]